MTWSDRISESEMQLRAFVEHAPAAVAMVDRDMRYLVVSRRWISDYHLGEGSILGHSHYEVFPEIPERWKEIYKRCLNGAVERCEEDRFPRSDGTLDWIRWEVRPWYTRIGTVGGLVLLTEVVTERKQVQALLEAEKRVFELIAAGAPLATVLDVVCWTVESGSPGTLCSVQLLDPGELHLRHVSGPSLPAAYIQSLDGQRIGPGAGPCGMAASLGRQVIVSDIAADPLCAESRALSLEYGLRACWATPIPSQGGTVSGTFVMFCREPRSPRPDELRRMERAIHLAAIAIEKDRNQETVRRGNAIVRAMTEGTTDAIYLKDRAGRYLMINPAGARALGKSVEEVIGRTDQDFFPPDTARAIQDHDAMVMQSGVSEVFEEAMTVGGAARTYLSTKDAYRHTDGTIIGVIGVARDITAQKRAVRDLEEWKQRYEAAVQVSGQILYDWDPRTNAVTYGGSLEQVLGYRVTELTGEAAEWLQYVHPDDRQGFIRELDRALVTGTSFHLQYRVRRKDGLYLMVRDDRFIFLNTQGLISRMVGFIVDISERIRWEEAIRQAQKMEAVGRLAGGIAHDFNNLLTAIMGYSDLLLPRLQSEEISRRYASEIRKASERAASLTQQLLTFSRRQMLHPKVMDLNTVVHDVCKMLTRVIGEDVELITKLEPSLGLIRADPGQFQQVLLNLAVNARDAMPNGGQLTIETRNADLAHTNPTAIESGRTEPVVHLIVTDTGIGMDAETKAHLFEPFFTTKSVGKGPGLGLAVVYGIIQQSGGSIDVVSFPGKGTTFRMSLPRMPSDASIHERSFEQARVQAGSETILVVEDEENVRQLIWTVLKAGGYQVIEASGPDEALRLSAEHGGGIDLLLTDVVMPGMSGRSLAQQLLAHRPGMKVLYMSGYAADDQGQIGQEESEEAFIQKPFASSELFCRVREVLDVTA
jgi:PAS domain S-box-containing protein